MSRHRAFAFRNRGGANGIVIGTRQHLYPPNTAELQVNKSNQTSPNETGKHRDMYEAATSRVEGQP
jgi:hypothetical protein